MAYRGALVDGEGSFGMADDDNEAVERFLPPALGTRDELEACRSSDEP